MNQSSDLNLRLNDIEETLYAEFGDIRKMIRGIKPKAGAESPAPAAPSFSCRFKETAGEVAGDVEKTEVSREVKPSRFPKLDAKRKTFLLWGVLGLSIFLNLGMFWMINRSIHERIPMREHIELMKRGARCTHDSH